ncbi:hypothetical protein [Salipiger sp. PrR002]|uniref:hypothetical protein n=1 Tax=Salipiger sp. PrR002 TaxID=2706489 RepID=UPI0013B70577|nr:hypothetical protein [Salipiger sp. PrR002]NDW02022.1 hypothetical protein [Salipiger sp. PrR002]NDW59140.1 hypothetical protein [Salipiger sp. PrR004]
MTINSLLYFRMAERLALTAVIVLVALVVMIGFWRTVQKFNLTDGGKLGIAGSFAFSTPVFVLLTIVGYAWVSLTNEITVDAESGKTTLMGDTPEVVVDQNIQALLRAAGNGAEDARPADRENDLAKLEEKLWAINCAARGRDLPPPVAASLVTVKLALIAPFWDNAWGDFAGFETWARSGTGKPSEPPRALFAGVDPRC